MPAQKVVTEVYFLMKFYLMFFPTVLWYLDVYFFLNVVESQMIDDRYGCVCINI